MEKVLVLSRDFYSMVDEKTGEIREGNTVFYVADYREPGAKAQGFKPIKLSADDGVLKDLDGKLLPALCELDFGTKPAAQGKVSVYVRGLKYGKAVDIFAQGLSSQDTKASKS